MTRVYLIRRWHGWADPDRRYTPTKPRKGRRRRAGGRVTQTWCADGHGIVAFGRNREAALRNHRAVHRRRKEPRR